MTEDPYRQLAAEVFNKPYSEVTDAERKAAKTAAYCYLYRGSVPTALFTPPSWRKQHDTDPES